MNYLVCCNAIYCSMCSVCFRPPRVLAKLSLYTPISVSLVLAIFQAWWEFPGTTFVTTQHVLFQIAFDEMVNYNHYHIIDHLLRYMIASCSSLFAHYLFAWINPTCFSFFMKSESRRFAFLFCRWIPSWSWDVLFGI